MNYAISIQQHHNNKEDILNFLKANNLYLYDSCYFYVYNIKNKHWEQFYDRGETYQEGYDRDIEDTYGDAEFLDLIRDSDEPMCIGGIESLKKLTYIE